MNRFHLSITIFNPFFQGHLNSRGKIDSVWFDNYSLFFEKILQGMNYNEINKFKLNLFNLYKTQLSYICVSQFINGEVLNGYSIVSSEFNVTSNFIALCIPSRKLRDKYFEYDFLRERYYVKSDFIFFLKS